MFSLIKSHYTAFSAVHTEKQLSAAQQDVNGHKPHISSATEMYSVTQALKASVTAVGSEQAAEIHDTQKAALVIFCFVLFLGEQFFRCMDFGVLFTCTCTNQGTVCLWRVSTGDVWGIQSNLQVLGHVCCLWLAGHVVPG